MSWKSLPGNFSEDQYEAVKGLIADFDRRLPQEETIRIAEVGRSLGRTTAAIAKICSELEGERPIEFISCDNQFDHELAVVLRDNNWADYVRLFSFDPEEGAEDVGGVTFNLIIINGSTAAQVERLLWAWVPKSAIGGKVIGVWDDYSIIAVKKVTRGSYERAGADGCLWLISAFSK